MASLAENAIQAALTGAWEEAIKFNQQILAVDPANIDALSRLGYAYSQYGNYSTACTVFQQILTIEPYNPIAKKNLTKCLQFKKNGNNDSQNNIRHYISPHLFVSDAQQTRIVHLVDLAPQTVLSTISVGECVFPFRKGFEIHIRDSGDTYLGKLPDDIGRKLVQLIQRDHICECFIKDLADKDVVIFVKWQDY